MKIIVAALFALFIATGANAQELNCQVTVSSQQVQGTDNKRIFDNLQKQAFEFVNNRKWTKDIFSTNERIECTMFINVTEKVSASQWKATIQVQSRRPVYKTSYPSTLFNYNDINFEFSYIENQPFDFNVNQYNNNLTSILAFYSYVILALDYDSYAPMGGTEHWQYAQQIVNNAQAGSDSGPGWKSFDGNKNRFWMIDNILNPMFNPIRNCYYQYHRKGLDVMYEKTDGGRAEVLKALESLKELHKLRPASYSMQLFFNAKADEVINIFKEAPSDEKAAVIETLNLIDPANANKYAKITEPK
ncbi:MAG: hypothetical protein K0S33_2567 [Bacteroidetes bacterium]|jgi:hypothetical protein|nr:hypothetical protein [Bacteroidota bacterium]